jgi:UDP-N-acetylmuramate--alanine ligase
MTTPAKDELGGSPLPKVSVILPILNEELYLRDCVNSILSQEYRGEFDMKNSKAVVYDDYAHHPTEIKASLQGLRELYPKGTKNITVLFQPHLYSRTKALFDDFAKSFQDADKILLLPIYFAREDKDESISSEKLAEAITLAGDKAQAFASFELAENYAKALNLGEKDVFVTMGAGEAYKVADKVFDIS